MLGWWVWKWVSVGLISLLMVEGVVFIVSVLVLSFVLVCV